MCIRIHSVSASLFACILLLMAASAQAQESNGAYIAYTWAGQASASGTYTPDAAYTFNPEGGVTVSRTGIGVYVVRFANLAPVFRDRTTSAEGEAGGAGHVQVTAYDTPGAYCKTSGWSESGTTLLVNVNCFEANGAPLNARFNVLFLEPAIHAGELGFVWANNATSSSYTPNGQWAYNGAGGDVQIDHTSTGFYTVRFSGMARYADSGSSGQVHVTGYGSDNTKCQSSGWGLSGDEVRVFVLCREPGGPLKDGRFTLMTLWPGTEVGTHAYALADQATASGPYSPTSAYNQGQPVTVTPLGTGSYRVLFGGLAASMVGGHVQVTARADPRTTCQVESWSPSGSSLRVDVQCTNEAGTPSNSQFAVSAFQGAAPTPGETNVTADFSRFPGGTLLENQFNDQGLRFSRGAIVIQCASEDAECLRSRSARNVIAPVELATEFKRDRLYVFFGARQSEVSASLNSAVLDGREREVVMQAKARSGSTLDEARGIVRGDPGWTTRLSVSATDISHIIVTSTVIGASDEDNQFVLDDLTYNDTTPWEPDVTPPTVRLWNASGGGTLPSGNVYTESPIDFQIQALDTGGLDLVTSQIVRVADGHVLQPLTTMCGTAASGVCGTNFLRTVAVGVTAPGEYEITVVATDFAGLVTTRTVPVTYEPVVLPSALVHKVEFNQSVTPRLYDKNIRLSDNVFLIPGKDLLIRYYLHSEDAPRNGFTASMRVHIERADGTILNRNLSPNAGAPTVNLLPLPDDVGTDRRDTLVTMRADLSRTLNYVVPGEWLNDATFAEIVLWDGVRELSRAQIRDIGANKATLGLQLVYVNDQQYLGLGRDNFDDNVRPFLEKAMPFSEVQILSERGFDFNGATLIDLSPCAHLNFALSLYGDDFGPTGLPVDTRLWWNKAILVDPGDLFGSTCTGIGQRPGRNMMSRYLGGNVGHEIGHNMGLRHVSMSHAEPGGVTWPYFHGAIGNPGDTFGIIIDPDTPPAPGDAGTWDLFLIDPCPTTDLSQRFASGGCALMNVGTTHGSVPHEVMSYGVNNSLDTSSVPGTRGYWVSYDTYSRMFDRAEMRTSSATAPLLASNSEASVGSDAQIASVETASALVQVLVATGIIKADDSAHVLPLVGRAASIEEVSQQQAGEYLVELVGAEGTVLAFTEVEGTEFLSEDTDFTFVQALLPVVENIAAVRISKEGTVVVEQPASPNAPHVRVLSPTRSAQYEDGTVPIQWEGSDADEDELTYIIEYSPDNGKTWETIRVILPGMPTAFDAPVDGLAEGIRGRIRVTASDGINISRSLSTPFFSVGPEPPATSNDAPEADAGDDQTVIVGQEVALDGASSSDPNGDALTFAWTLEGPGNPALTNAETASSMFCAAEVGSYTATLIVNDGTVDSAPVATTITALSIGSGLEGLIADINALVADGSLDRRLARALTGRLTRAQRLLGRGRSASSMFRTVRTRIGTLERTGDLTPSQADALRSSLDAITGAIDSPCAAVAAVEGTGPQIELAEEVVLGLAPPRPNPTSGRTVLTYGLEEEGAVRLAVYDALGREVGVLVNGTVQAGNHAAVFEARGIPAGVYVVRLIVDGVSTSTRRLTVVR